MMRIGDSTFFIACNHDGDELVNPFLKKFNVNSADTLIESIKWCNFVIGAESKNLTNWGANLSKKSTYSDQEGKTLGCFALPVDIPKTGQPLDLYMISRCAWKNAKKLPVAPAGFQEAQSRDWMGGLFRQLLAIPPPKTDSPAAPRTASFTTMKLGGDVNLTNQVTLITDGQKVHAELKLLALLTKMIIDGKVVTGNTVYLGGLKRACKSCDGWITKYKVWLATKGVILEMPQADNRASASPGVWDNPAVEQGVKAVLPELFA